MREIEIERPAAEYAESRGWFEVKIEKASVNGIPDRVFIRNGRTIWIEFKAPLEEPTPQQRKRHREMRAHGAEVFVIDSLRDAYEVLR